MSLIAKLKEGQMELEELTAHSSTLVYASRLFSTITITDTFTALLEERQQRLH